MSKKSRRLVVPLPNLESRKRMMAYSAAAGLGAFTCGSQSDAAIIEVDPADIELTGDPNGDGIFGWANGGGIDIDNNGSPDVGFFRGFPYSGYLFVRDQMEQTGDMEGYVYGSGAVTLLSNPNNIDPGGGIYEADDIQGFIGEQVIGDDETLPVGASGHEMRSLYEPYDWDNTRNGGPSYLGFQIDLSLSGASGTGFGWIEVIVREEEWAGEGTGFTHPEITITRWAYTDDGSTIETPEAPPSNLVEGDANNDQAVTGADLIAVQQNFGKTGPADGLLLGDANDEGNVTGADLISVQQNFGNVGGPSLLLGDANNDQAVTGADLIAVQQNFGATGAPDGLLMGDANDDGAITGADLISVQQNFGNTLGPAQAPLPEPTSLALLAAGAGALAFRRPRSTPNGDAERGGQLQA